MWAVLVSAVVGTILSMLAFVVWAKLQEGGLEQVGPLTPPDENVLF